MSIPAILQGPFLTLDTAAKVLRDGFNGVIDEIEDENAVIGATLPTIDDIAGDHAVEIGDVRGFGPQSFPAVRVVSAGVQYDDEMGVGLVDLEHEFIVRVYVQSWTPHAVEPTTIANSERLAHIYEAVVRRVIERDLTHTNGALGVYQVSAVGTSFPAPLSTDRRTVQVVDVAFVAQQRARRSHFTA